MRRREIYDIVFVIGFVLVGLASIVAGIWCFSKGEVPGGVILVILGVCLFCLAGVVGANP